MLPDLRGFSRTSMVETPFSYTDDLRVLCVALDIESAAFVGASMGGTAVIDLALAEPELVACFVTIGSDPSGYEMSDPGTIEG